MLCNWISIFSFFFSSRRRHTRFDCDWSSDVCSSDLARSESPGTRAERNPFRDGVPATAEPTQPGRHQDRKSTRLNSSHSQISYAVFCLKKKTNQNARRDGQTHTE